MPYRRGAAVSQTWDQVWWPNHDHLFYGGDRLPVWERRIKASVDPDIRQPLPAWDEALDQVQQPVHVVTLGHQVHSKGILGGTDQAGRHIGYLTKYVTKSFTEVVEATTEAQRHHAERLHAELSVTPCSPRCAVRLLYGIQPVGVASRTVPGRPQGVRRASPGSDRDPEAGTGQARHRLTSAEYRSALRFLAETAERGELPLLSNVLFEAVVEEGPFYVAGARCCTPIVEHRSFLCARRSPVTTSCSRAPSAPPRAPRSRPL